MKAFAVVFAVILPSAVFAEPPKEVEMVTQVLEPTGGKISRPKNWFYAESHRGPVYTWIISAEDTSDNQPYTTGVKIQAFIGIEKAAGKTPKQFLNDFVNSKENDKSITVIKTCGKTEHGLFNRVCLETEEGDYHILYSLFWGSDNLDVAVVVIAGTTQELWETHASTFNKMDEFELIDMKRFDN